MQTNSFTPRLAMTQQLAEQELEKLYSKIEKLLALQTSSNEHEAALAAERVQELLLKYNISLESVERRASKADVAEQVVYEMPGGRKYHWCGTLADKVAKVNFTKVFWRGATLRAIGRPVNIIVTKQTYLYLAEAVERIADQEWKAWKKLAKPSGGESTRWYNSFVWGCVSRLCDRLEEHYQEQMRNGSEQANASALVCMSLYQKEEAAIAEYVAQNLNLKQGARSQSKFSYEGYANGMAAGGKISLSKQVSGGASEQRVLAGG